MMSEVNTNTTQQLLPNILPFTSALNTIVIVLNSLYNFTCNWRKKSMELWSGAVGTPHHSPMAFILQYKETVHSASDR
jgi:hypothetical protein